MFDKLTVVSTFADDVVINEQEDILRVNNGGPAEFFSRVFAQTGSTPTMITGRRRQVRIKVVPGVGEVGQVVDGGPAQLIPAISSPNLLISTVVREWSLDSLLTYEGRIFLDVQGFVRNPGNEFGEKLLWTEVKAIASKLFCIKATETELRFLPDDFVQDQIANRCLLLTKGAEGVEVFFRGERIIYPPREIIASPDTIGAGDTFLASFVSEYISHEDWKKAVSMASQSAVDFLKTKIAK